jgi:general L-amino acid transport system substrate-binding protein
MGANLKLDAKWAGRIIGQVGNYGEMFTRNLGPSTALKIARGINQLWSKGGIMYAPPVR